MISYVYDQFQFSKNLPIKMMISYLENGEPRFNKEKFLELLNRLILMKKIRSQNYL